MFLTHALRAIYRAAVVTGDSLWKYVTLLLSGTPPAVTFISDASTNGNVLTLNGDTRPSNFNPYTPGYYSNFFDGTGDYLSLPSNSAFAFGTGAYTMEGWIYITAAPTYVSTMFEAGGATNGISLGVAASGAVNIGKYGIGNVISSTAGDVPSNQWVHVAAVRASTATNDTKIYVNGVLKATGTDNNNWTVITSPTVGGIALAGYVTNGYISNLRVVKGTAVYTAAFTPPTAPLTAISGTSLLTCQSNRLIDNSLNNFAITKNGDTTVSGFIPFVTPTTANVNTLYSTYFDGTGDYLNIAGSSAAVAFGTGDFTIEMWYFAQVAGEAMLVDFRAANGTTFGCIYYAATTNYLTFYDGGSTFSSTSQPIVLNTWNHIAAVRSGGTLRMYVNGVQSYSGANTSSYNGSKIIIGAHVDTTFDYLKGYVSNLRILKGTGLYTGTSFTVPTAPLTAITNTSLLTCQDATIKDNSTNAFAITSFGQAQPIAQSPFTQVTTALDTTYLGSGYFDGTGDYLSATPTAIGSAAFGVEGWFYAPDVTTLRFIISLGYNSNNSLFLAVGSGVVQLTVQDNSGGFPINNVTIGSVTTNTWVYFYFGRGVTTGGNAPWYYGLNGTVATSTAGSPTFPSRNFEIGYAATRGLAGSYFLGNVSNVRLIVGSTPYTANFTPPTANLTAITNTSLLTCQDATLKDNSTNAFAITSFGQAQPIAQSPFTQVTTALNTTFLGSGYFDGTGDYLTPPVNAAFAMGTGEFTIECWVYFINSVANHGVFQLSTSLWPAATSGLAIYVSGGTGWGAYYNGTGNNGTPAPMVNTWYHVALVRSGTTTKLYVNGSQILTATDTTNYTGTYLSIGGYFNTSFLMAGYISNFRIVKGTALYTANFAPPAVPLTAVTNTQLLTLQTDQPVANKQFIDNSTNNFPITQFGNTTQGTFSPYGSNWSTFFATNNYVSYAMSQAFTSTTNFCVEAWLYPRTTTSNEYYWFETVQGGLFFDSALLPNNTIFIRIQAGTGATLTSTGTVTINTWNHVAITYDGTTLRVFINGVASGSVAFTMFTATTTQCIIGYNNYAPAPRYFDGYISNWRMSVGTARYTTAFTPLTTPFAPDANTALLALQTRNFLDTSPKALTATITGTPSVQEFSPFGNVTQTPQTYSGFFDGTGDYLQTPASSTTALIGGTGLITTTSTLTIECWIYQTQRHTTAGYPVMFGDMGTTGSIYWGFGPSSTGLLTFYWYTGSEVKATGSDTIPLNTWTHIAVSISSGAIKLFVNGNLQTITGSSTTGNQSGTYGYLSLGMFNTGGAAFAYYGYISNLRVTRSALYTAAFTPPTAPLTAIANTSLLTCQSPTFIDSSTNNFTITAFGDSRPRQFNPFGFTNTTNQSYTPALYGGSAYFDGTGDYLTTASNSAVAFGTGDFTIEGWFYFQGTISTYKRPWGFSDANDNIEIFGSVLRVGGGTQGTLITGTATILANTWYHIALVRASGVYKLWLNGVQDGGSATNSWNSAARQMGIAAYPTGVDPITGYVSDLRITKTAVYKSNFVPPLAPLTATTGTTLLLNMDKAGVSDSSRSNDLETVGDAKIRDETPYAGSYYSNYFDGSGDYLSAASNAAFALPGNFTFECWFNSDNTATTSQWCEVPVSNGFSIYYSGTQIFVSAYGVVALITYTYTMPVGVWTHLAVVRNGTGSNNLVLYINGVSVATATTNVSFAQGAFRVGGGSYIFKGYISNARLIKGTAQYTANFTPSTTPLTAISGTSLLTCQSKSLVDNSSNAFTITRNGDVAVKSQNPFQKNTYSSMFFDGTGDYLVSPSNASNSLGTDFTVEAWVFPTVASGTYGLAIAGTYDGGTNSGWSVVINRSTGGTLGVAFIHANAVQSSYGTYLASNAWTHVAVARSGSSLRLFVNGVVVTTTTYAAADSIVAPLYVGSQGTASSLFNGYIADLRITKSARYTATFTPPTAPLPTA